MTKDYSEYLPHMDVKDGLARVLGNKPLYRRLLGKFKGPELAENLADAVRNKEPEKIMYSAHALKGTCANLGFPLISELAGKIEALAKESGDAESLLPRLSEATCELMAQIESFLESPD